MAEHPTYSVEKYSSERFEMGYIRLGQGSRQLIVIPGLNVKSILTTPELIALQLKLFAEHGFTVYVFDRKDPTPEPYSIAQMASDTLQVLRALSLDNLYLFGHSQGGMISQCMVLEEPHLFNKVIFSGTVSHLDSQAEELFRTWIELAAADDPLGLYENFEHTVFSEEFGTLLHQDLIREAQTVTKTELLDFIAHTRNMFDFDVRARLGEIQTESLVIGSKADRVFSYALVRELADRLNCASFFFEHCGHSPALETPLYNEKLLEFLSK
ncbi:MAG: alpha/beta hydrolase [Succinivibrio sp.]|nr:alpha/beta hydrolase [Succinivibrio sp.]